MFLYLIFFCKIMLINDFISREITLNCTFLIPTDLTYKYISYYYSALKYPYTTHNILNNDYLCNNEVAIMWAVFFAV